MADRRIDQKNSGRIASRQRKSRLRQEPEKIGGKGHRIGQKRKSSDKQMPRLYIKGIGMMAGLIIGAGVFALPYAFAQAGVFWGTVHLVISLFIVYLFLCSFTPLWAEFSWPISPACLTDIPLNF